MTVGGPATVSRTNSSAEAERSSMRAVTRDGIGRGDPPRLALRWPAEVAAALGVGDDFVKRHGLIAELRAVRLGSQRFVPVAELERGLAENARLPLDDAA